MEFRKVEDKIIFIYYYSEYLDKDWVRESLKIRKEVTFKRTLNFLNEEVFDISNPQEVEELEDIEILDSEYPPVAFVFAEKEGDYYKIPKSILKTNNNFYFFEDIDIEIEYLIAESKISILKQIDELVKEDVYIGGDSINNIPFEDFLGLIDNFPTTHEKKLYAEARVSSVIKNYFETTLDSEAKFQNFLNKKVSKKGQKLNKIFQEYELEKYNTILEKLEGMISSENSYSEDQWQDEILEIILLLYPKYILSFKTVHLKIDSKSRRFLDFMLVDSNGNIDVIEIKKPFENSIMSSNVYRKNYIPHKDLTGTVMQLEKYLYHLNRYGEAGEKKLTEKYKKDLPDDLNIKITNPKGFIIMGRENNLSIEQKTDFEVVKRKYKNVIDIITYDDLIQRLKFTIEQIKRT